MGTSPCGGLGWRPHADRADAGGDQLSRNVSQGVAAVPSREPSLAVAGAVPPWADSLYRTYATLAQPLGIGGRASLPSIRAPPGSGGRGPLPPPGGGPRTIGGRSGVCRDRSRKNVRDWAFLAGRAEALEDRSTWNKEKPPRRSDQPRGFHDDTREIVAGWRIPLVPSRLHSMPRDRKPPSMLEQTPLEELSSDDLAVVAGREARRTSEIARRDDVSTAAQNITEMILRDGEVPVEATAALVFAALVNELGGPRPTARISAAKELKDLLGLGKGGTEAKENVANAAMVEALGRMVDSAVKSAGAEFPE